MGIPVYIYCTDILIMAVLFTVYQVLVNLKFPSCHYVLHCCIVYNLHLELTLSHVEPPMMTCDQLTDIMFSKQDNRCRQFSDAPGMCIRSRVGMHPCVLRQHVNASRAAQSITCERSQESCSWNVSCPKTSALPTDGLVPNMPFCRPALSASLPASLGSMTRSYFTLVISMYNEDISWSEANAHVQCLQPRWSHRGLYMHRRSDAFRGLRTVFNKGHARDDLRQSLEAAGDVYQEVPNVGRDLENIFRWLIANYDNLPEYVAFTQAHFLQYRKSMCPGTGVLHKNTSNPTTTARSLFSAMLQEAEFWGFSMPFAVSPVHMGTSEKRPWSFGFAINTYKHQALDVYEPTRRANVTTFGAWFRLHGYCIEASLKEAVLYVYPNGQFALSRSVVRAFSTSYYEERRKELNHSASPVETHYFERALVYTFALGRRMPTRSDWERMAVAHGRNDRGAAASGPCEWMDAFLRLPRCRGSGT